MPQKHNPISSLYTHPNAAVVRQNVASLLEAGVAGHERSTGPWAVENKPLVDLLAQDKEISKHVPRAELEKMCDPRSISGLPARWSIACSRRRRRRNAGSGL